MLIQFAIKRVFNLFHRLALERELKSCYHTLKNSAEIKPIKELKIKENDCMQLQANYESCQIIHDQMTQIFKNRQKKYLEEYKKNKLSY